MQYKIGHEWFRLYIVIIIPLMFGLGILLGHLASGAN